MYRPPIICAMDRLADPSDLTHDLIEIDGQQATVPHDDPPADDARQDIGPRGGIDPL